MFSERTQRAVSRFRCVLTKVKPVKHALLSIKHYFISLKPLFACQTGLLCDHCDAVWKLLSRTGGLINVSLLSLEQRKWGSRSRERGAETMRQPEGEDVWHFMLLLFSVLPCRSTLPAPRSPSRCGPSPRRWSRSAAPPSSKSHRWERPWESFWKSKLEQRALFHNNGSNASCYTVTCKDMII